MNSKFHAYYSKKALKNSEQWETDHGRSETLYTLNLSNLNGVIELNNSVVQNTEVQLNLDLCQELVTYLNHHLAIEALDLSNNEFTQSAKTMRVLAEAFSHLSKREKPLTINLSNCKLGIADNQDDTPVIALVNALQENNCKNVRVDLSGNFIKNTSAEKIFSMLKTPCCVLNLSLNDFTDAVIPPVIPAETSGKKDKKSGNATKPSSAHQTEYKHATTKEATKSQKPAQVIKYFITELNYPKPKADSNREIVQPENNEEGNSFVPNSQPFIQPSNDEPPKEKRKSVKTPQAQSRGETVSSPPSHFNFSLRSLKPLHEQLLLDADDLITREQMREASSWTSFFKKVYSQKKEALQTVKKALEEAKEPLQKQQLANEVAEIKKKYPYATWSLFSHNKTLDFLTKIDKYSKAEVRVDSGKNQPKR